MVKLGSRSYSANASDYKLLEEVGYGPSATVYRTIYLPLNEVVAVKCLDLDRCNSNLDDVRREAQTMSLIDHANVVSAYCSFVVEHNLWVVMPFMAEGSCLHLMKIAYPDGFEELAIGAILKETLRALHYLHQQGHIHRDVKAGNILLGTNGAVKLADFGVSACMFDAGDRQRSRNTFVGIPCWMAPEVLQPGSGYTSKDDIWSFGITALELAHGHAPFSKHPSMKVLPMTIQNASPGLDYDRDKRFSKSFKEMVEMCLVKDQMKRPAAEKLLKHSFFKLVKAPELIVKTLFTDLPPLWNRVKALQHKDSAQLALKKMPSSEEEAISQSEYKCGVSAWNFNVEDLESQASLVQDDENISGTKEEVNIKSLHPSCSQSTLAKSISSDEICDRERGNLIKALWEGGGTLVWLMVDKGQRKYIQLMLALNWILIAEGSSGSGGGGGAGGRSSSNIFGVGGSSNVGIAVAVTAMAGLALAALVYSRRGSLKSPWSHRRRKHALSPQQWRSLFTPDGKLNDGGVKFLKKVRGGGVDPNIRVEVWPFLLGVYDFNSSKDERDAIRTQKRKEYENLIQQCRQRLISCSESFKLEETAGSVNIDGSADFGQVLDSPPQGEAGSGSTSITTDETILASKELNHTIQDSCPHTSHAEDIIQGPSLQLSDVLLEEVGDRSGITSEEASAGDTESSDSDSFEETENAPLLFSDGIGEDAHDQQSKENLSPINMGIMSKPHLVEDFETWQRIIRLDAVRANDEWIIYSPSQAKVSEIKAQQLASSVGLKDYDHLEPYRIFHAARLVAILEAYALYDSEIGYCQGMSDLLSPIVSVIEDDSEAFWCFVGFMKKARHNFRLDEVGIRRQLDMVSKIIKFKDSHLYKHLEKLEAGDCFFVYRMVVVLFRRELTFEQTLCLWEVMWADQAAIRAGITKSAWGRIRLRAPPTEDLLLYAIAACVLQRRKLIIEKYSSMEDIMRECNSMAGHLDVWKLLDDAHDLVVTLHNKI